MTDTAAVALPRLDEHISRIEEALENIVSFWYPRCIDELQGGYHFNHSRNGDDLGPSPKMIITQARTVWLFARLAVEGFRTSEMLDAASHGYRFLTEHMQDLKYGGYYWLLRANGTPRRVRKHICAQASVLFGLSEYARASGSHEALIAADELFNMVEQRAHDDANGGYREAFSRKWGTPLPWQRPYMGRGASRHKSMNTHLHFVETLRNFLRVNPSALVRERLVEAIGIQTSHVYAAYGEASTNLFEPDWTPVLNRPEARYSYGHDLENIWLVVDACEAAEVPIEQHLGLLERAFDTCLRLGYDHGEGGFFYSGLPGEAADERQKVWWVQAESMVAALMMYQLTSDLHYFDVFEKTWHFVDERLIDWQYGEWYYAIAPDGKPVDYKANEWKDGYHNGRAMLECLRLLRGLRPATA